MPSGYKNGKPDLNFWQEKIAAGIEFRQKHAREKQWATWRKMYRGDWDDHILPSNLFFKMIRTVVPRIYFRNPSVSVYPAKPGMEVMAFSKIAERMLNKVFKQIGMKKEMKRMAQNAFMYGTGIGKMGYGAEFTPTPDEGSTGEPMVKNKYRVEYSSGIQANMPWFRSTHPGDFVVPEGAERLEDSRWVCHILRRDKDDVANDPRLSHGKSVHEGRAGPDEKAMNRIIKPSSSEDEVELWEIRDKKTGRVFVLAPYNTDKVLLDEPDELQVYGRVPFYEATFNMDDEVFWGVPDSQILEPLQQELNEIRTLEMKHRRMSIVKILAKKGAITEEQAAKIVDENVLPVIWTEGEPTTAIEQVQASQVPQDLIQAVTETMQDARETVGFGRNQFGEYSGGSGDTSATEAQIVKQAAEIRVDERRDMLADVITEVVKDMNQIIFEQWDEEQVIDVIGPQGFPLWVQFRPDMLDPNQFEIHVDPDSSVPETKQMREQKALQVYKTFMQDPMVNRENLVRYAMNELHGAEYDAMVNVAGGMGMSPQTPMGPADLGNLMNAMGEQGGTNQPGEMGPGVSNNPASETTGMERAEGAAGGAE